MGHRVDELRKIIELECGNVEKIEADVMELAAIVDFETVDDAELCMHKVSNISALGVNLPSPATDRGEYNLH